MSRIFIYFFQNVLCDVCMASCVYFNNESHIRFFSLKATHMFIMAIISDWKMMSIIPIMSIKNCVKSLI